METGQPSRTAFSAARYRAAHQLIEGGEIFTDPLAVRILGVPPDAEEAPGRRAMRLFIAARTRFAEDALAAAVAHGTRQLVVLGAGLDTFAYRNPWPQLRVFEVDHPDTQAWKRHRLADAAIEVPENLEYVPVDFERQALRLAAEPGAFFLWLGVVPYLTHTAVEATLGAIGSVTGAEVVLDYPTGVAGLDEESLRRRQRLAERTAAVGEPLLSSFEPDEMAALLRGAGFDEVEDLARADILTRFLGLPAEVAAARSGVGGGHLVRGRRTS